MNRHVVARHFRYAWPLIVILAWPIAGNSQVMVAEIEELTEAPTISQTEINDLVGPIALYPDDLLAIVLPASTYPLQVVEASRFLEDLENDPSLEPDEDWDDSIVALLNYPEIVALLNEDLDWTWRLGEAVVGQQSDVISAIEEFRDRAYAAGNLESDDYQLVSQEDGAIHITPAQDDVIYVPYYEPEQVVVYQPRPVYNYYPNAYPVYYYPYPSHYSFNNHFYRSQFWGVTTAYAIGWHTYSLNVFHPSFYGHPYYGYSYRDSWWYRRPDIHVYNRTYVRNNTYVSHNRYRNGDTWSASPRRTVSRSDQRITRTRSYTGSNTRPSSHGNASAYTSTNQNSSSVFERTGVDAARHVRRSDDPEIRFRNRPSSTSTARSAPSPQPSVQLNSSSQPRSTSQRRSTSQPRSSLQSRSDSQPRASSQSRSQPRASSQSRSQSRSQPRSQPRSSSKPQSRPSSSASRSNSRSTGSTKSRNKD